MARPKKRSKTRGHGKGAVFTRPHKRTDGTSYVRWQGAVDLGYSELGELKRKTVYGKTRKEVLDKLLAIKHQVDDGNFSNTRLTVKEYMEKWVA